MSLRFSSLIADCKFGADADSKGTLISYTDTLPLDCVRDSIRISALCPGATAGTTMRAGAHGSAAMTGDLASSWFRSPLHIAPAIEQQLHTNVYAAHDIDFRPL